MTGQWTTKELHEQGLTWRDINMQLDEGTLYRLSRGIYTTGKPAPEEALRALQHRHPRVVFSGVTAAGVYGLTEITAPALGLLPHGSQPITNAALHARSSRRRRRRRLRGINLDTPVATIAACHEQLGFWKSVRFLENSYSGLRASQEFDRDIGELGRADRERLVPVLRRTVIGASSRMERLFINDLHRHGLEPIPNFRLGPYHWDVGLRRGTTVVDLDSRKFHAPDDAGRRYQEFIVDRWKTNHAIQSGWAGLRYTDDCLRLARDQAIEQIRRTVEHRSRRPGLRRSPAPVPGMHKIGIWKFHPALFD